MGPDSPQASFLPVYPYPSRGCTALADIQGPQDLGNMHDHDLEHASKSTWECERGCLQG